MDLLKNDPTSKALKQARAAGVVGSRFDVVGVYDQGERTAGIHQAVRDVARRHGMRVVGSSSGLCCLPCRGRGYVDDATARGCVRSSMRCPTCLGRGDFIVEARKEARPDGWPLCPECGEDELGCMAVPQSPDYEWTLAKYLEHDLFCYRCGKVTWTPDAAPQAQVTTGGGE